MRQGDAEHPNHHQKIHNESEEQGFLHGFDVSIRELLVHGSSFSFLTMS
jgi:hypothetical protein